MRTFLLGLAMLPLVPLIATSLGIYLIGASSILVYHAWLDRHS
jgi:hypothetical protein